MTTPLPVPQFWNRTTIDGVDLDYVIRGSGEPVVLMHAGVCADFFAPLAEELALADRYCVLRYHRVGYAGSTRVPGPVPQSAVQQAFLAAVVRPALAHYQAGDKAGAVEIWLQGTCGPDYRVALERVLPGAVEQTVADATRPFSECLSWMEPSSYRAPIPRRVPSAGTRPPEAPYPSASGQR